MKIFFEAIEKTENEEGEFIKIEVKSREEAVEKAKGCSKSKYQVRVHFCYHDEETPQPCRVEEL
jgi:hypothetical protein